MGIINKKVFMKSYMLEFLSNKEPIIFTFSVPPKGEDFDFGQRLSETKTFGGSVFDNYGNDTIRITLSGSTGNQEKKLIYRGLKQLPLYLNGEAEIFELQKTIYEWHTLGDDSIEKRVYLYDLSKMNIAEFATLKPSRNYWRVHIKNLKIKRDASAPYTFNYTLEMLGLVDDVTSAKSALDDVANNVAKFTKAMNTVQSVLDYTEAAVSTVEEGFNAVSEIANLFKSYENMSTKGVVLSVLKGVDSSTRILTGNSNNTLYNTAKSCLSIVSQCTDWFGDTEAEKAGKIQDTSSFRVMFNSNGGTTIKSQLVDYAKTATKPTEPIKQDYEFVGWYKDNETFLEVYDFDSEVTSAFTLYAKWNLAIATVAFNAKGGSTTQSEKVSVGECATLPIPPTKAGFLFDKWCTDYAATQAFDFLTPITDSLTLYAAWKEVCTVTFDVNGGSEVETQVVSVGTLAIYPKTPTKENYTFTYWCTDSECTTAFDFSTPITRNITLYAQWIQFSNTVTFDSNGGSAVAPEKVVIGGYATEPITPTKTGFDFNYWCTDSALTNEFHFDRTPINSAITLYAKWTEKILTVTFETNGGSAVDNQTVNYNSKVIFPDIPTKENCVFEMWLEKNGDEFREFDFSSQITDDMTLYAKWFGE